MFSSFVAWAKESIVDDIVMFAIVIAAVESIAQNTIKTSDAGLTNKFFVGAVIYGLVGFLLHVAYARYPISRLNTIWSSMSIMLAVGFGYFLYGEQQSQWSVLSFLLAMGAIWVQSMHTSASG